MLIRMFSFKVGDGLAGAHAGPPLEAGTVVSKKGTEIPFQSGHS